MKQAPLKSALKHHDRENGNMFAIRLAAAALAAMLIALVATAQPYPGKPIRIIAAQSPGGASDLFARVIGQKFTETWKQPVVVETRPGAGGAIGTEYVAKSPPDGYTLLLAAAGQLVINQSLYPKLGYDPVKDLAPAGFFASSPLLLVAHPAVPVKSIKELVAFGKAHPNGLNWGSGGSGSPAHLAAELFWLMSGTRMTHVPFKGVAPSVVAVIAGQIDLTFATIAATLQQVRAHRLRALGMSTAQRSQAMPEVPTIAEAGVPGYEMNTWYGLFGPAATPKDVVQKLNAEVMRIVKLPDVRERLFADGADPGNLTLDQFAELIRRDAARWAKVIKQANVKAD
jgi:tripartite-type tricarboxylate transporter receptor subunit TctC